MPSRDQIPKASLAIANKGDTNTYIDGGILGRGGPNLYKPEQDIKVKLANRQANLNNPLFSTKLFEEF